ncbi:MAG TPA: MFS transporter [Anaeromyxobacter sp.]|nr:MFS transporter [Anaeromyxobacter sp.]
MLGALALGLAGSERLDRTVGANQGFNHAGNIAAALLALWIVGFDVRWVFFAVVVVSLAAAGSTFFIEGADPGPLPAATRPPGSRVGALLRDRRIVFLVASTALFHLANAPVMPLVALAVKHVDGTERQVAMVVLIAQVVMVPVALAAGWSCGQFGRRWTFAVGFVVLPLRIASYALARSPHAYLALQALDGIGAGIYGVAIVAVCADLTAGRGSFNSLLGVVATAQAVGGVLGPILAGWLVQQLGFGAAFLCLAALAAMGTAAFLSGVPETRRPALAVPKGATEAAS